LELDADGVVVYLEDSKADLDVVLLVSLVLTPNGELHLILILINFGLYLKLLLQICLQGVLNHVWAAI
jgi:hypothetical protein